MERLLHAFGYRPSSVATVEAALALSGQARFDVLLSDLLLPDGDGWGLLRQLDARGCRPPHAIAMSGLGSPSDYRRSQEAGFVTLLVKPFAPEDLEGALRGASVAPVRAPAAEAEPAPPTHWAQRMHDGLCQQLAAAALWQGVLIHRLEAMMAPGGMPDDAVTEAHQVGRLLDEALGEARVLMREMRAGDKPPGV